MSPEQAETDAQPVHPISRMINFEVGVQELPRYVCWNERNEAERLNATLKWVRQMNAILADHRPLDGLRLTVRVENGFVCSGCKEPWESHEEDGQRICSNCGKLVQEDSP